MSNYHVVCEDGQIRHAQKFGTKAEAEQFAEWGHICTRGHTIIVTTVEENDE